MTKALIGLLLEAALKSAMEASATLSRMDAEGRTKATEAEIKALQDATDVMADMARSKAALL